MLTAAVARPVLELRKAGLLTGEVPGLGVRTGMGVWAVSAPVFGSWAIPEAPPSCAGASVCPGAAVWPGTTCTVASWSGHLLYLIDCHSHMSEDL